MQHIHNHVQKEKRIYSPQTGYSQSHSNTMQGMSPQAPGLQRQYVSKIREKRKCNNAKSRSRRLAEMMMRGIRLFGGRAGEDSTDTA